MDNRYYTYADYKANTQPLPEQDHVVIDMRTPRERDKTQTVRRRPQRRQRQPKRFGRNLLTVLCILILTASTVLLIADFMLPSGVAGYVAQTFSPLPPRVYAVCHSICDTLSEARAVSDGVRAGGGAGFIAYDGKYNVLLSAYPTEQEAQSVAAKNGGTVYTLLTAGLTAADLPLAYRTSVKAIIDYHQDVYAALYQLSDQLAHGGASIAYCKQHVDSIREGLVTRAQGFLDATANATDATTQNYRAALVATIAALDNLKATDDSLMLADLRWTYIMVLRINRV